MAGQLEPSQAELAHQVTDVQRVGGGIEPDVGTDRSGGQACTQRVSFGGVVDEAAGLEIGEEVHTTVDVATSGASPHPWFALPTTVPTVADTSAIDLVTTRFREFADISRPRAPLYARLSEAIAQDLPTARLLLHAPAEQRLPVLLFACVHALLLEHRDHPLARWYPNLATGAPPAGDPWPTFRTYCATHEPVLAGMLASRTTQTNEVGRTAVMLPVLGLLERELGPLAQLDVGASAGLNLQLDRYAFRYEPEPEPGSGGRTVEVGAPSSVTMTCGIRGAVPIPAAVPTIAARLGIDRDPVDVGDPDQVRWLEACVWPDQADRFRRLEAALAIAAADPPPVRRADAVDGLAAALDVLDELGGRGHPVVTTSWVLCYLPEPERRRFVDELDRIGAERDLSWLALESPAQSPGLPHEDRPERVELTTVLLARWRNGRREVHHLGVAHPHGAWLHWDGPSTPF